MRDLQSCTILKLVGAPGPERFAITKSVMLCGGSVAPSALPVSASPPAG